MREGGNKLRAPGKEELIRGRGLNRGFTVS